MPNLTVNGTRREYAEAEFPSTVGALIDALGLDRKAVVAEVDGAIVSRADYETPLRSGATVELVQFVGGG